MKLIVREHINQVIEPVVKTYHVTVDALETSNKIPLTIGLDKGDMVVFISEAQASRLPLGDNGQILTANPDSELGAEWDNSTIRLTDPKLTKALEQIKRPWTPKYSTMIRLNNHSVTPGVPSTYKNFEMDEVYDFLPYSGMLQVGGDILHDRNLSTFFSAVENPASILYQPQWSEGRYQAANYGVICSSYVGYLISNKMYYGASAIGSQQTDFYDYTCPADLEVGDVIDSSSHVELVVGFDLDCITYDVKKILVTDSSEARHYLKAYTPEDFYTNFGPGNVYGYKIGRIRNLTLRDVPAVRFTTDVIAELGNSTYYYTGDEVWLYVPNGDTLYYKEENDANYSSVLLSSLTTKTVNTYTVYDVSSLMSIAGKYYFTTDTSHNTQCELLRIDTGDITIDNNNDVTLENYSSNITPLYYCVMKFSVGSSDSTVYPAPTGYVTGRQIPGTMIEQDTFSPSVSQGSASGWYLRVHYKTDFGVAHKDSEFIYF